MTLQRRTMAHSPAVIFWSLSTAALTLGLIVFGAVVRVTDSGLGCGTDWPLCNGTIFPPLDNITAWIEWLHRLFALLIGFFGMATLIFAWRQYRLVDRRVLNMTLLAAALFVVQSGLGAIVVFLELPPTFVTLHLGVAMLLLAALLGAATLAWHQPAQTPRSDSIPLLAWMNAAMAFVAILTGALVRGSGATLSCATWPLCDDGAVLPIEQGQLAAINMIHRLSAAAMCATLIILVWQVFRKRGERAPRLIVAGAALALALQVGVGALFVFTAAGRAWGALHVGLAAAVWALLATLALMERINKQSTEG